MANYNFFPDGWHAFEQGTLLVPYANWEISKLMETEIFA